MHKISGENSKVETLNPQDLIDAFKTHGFVMLDGFDIDLEGFRALVKTYGTEFLSQGLLALRDRMSKDGVISSVVKTNVALDLHTERGYSPEKPDICWFYCIKPASQGGATLFCDGEKLFAALPKDIQEMLITKKLMFHHEMEESVWKDRYGEQEEIEERFSENPSITFFTFHGDGVLEYVYKTSGVLKKEATGTYVFANSLLNIWKNMNAPEGKRRGSKSNRVFFDEHEVIPKDFIERIERVAEPITEAVVLQPKQLVMLDNFRYLHGRQAFEGERKIAAAFSKANF